MNTKDKRPYKAIRLTDRHVPTWVIHGGPVHIAAFWSSESDAIYRCKELNDVHEAAIAELDKAPVVTHMNIDLKASQETKAAVAEVVKAAYSYKAQRVLTYEEIQDIATECFGDMLNKTALKDLELKGMAVTCSNYETALRFARDNGYLAPSAGLTVHEAMEACWRWAIDAQMVNATTDPYYLNNDLRARLTAAINAKAAKA